MKTPPKVSHRRLDNLVGLASRKPPTVGATPHEVVHVENKWRLLRYEPPDTHTARGPVRPGPVHPRPAHPIPLIPPLINRHYVLDLMPGKSMAEWLVARGHDVY